MPTKATTARTNFEDPGHYNKADRDKIATESPEDFAGSNRTYPIKTPQDVEDAAGLVGNSSHDSEATLKANIKKIAHRKGPEFVAKLPESWKSEDEGRAASAEADPSEERGVVALTRFVLPQSLRVMDPEQQIVRVCATSEAVDTYGTVFAYEASKDAFQRWYGNVREMHDRKAVGRGVEVICDDADRRVYVDLRISRGAPDTWEKVQDGTLNGASIGASNAQWEMRMVDGVKRQVFTKYDLAELSLVDYASNPDGRGVAFRGVEIVRADGTAGEVLDGDESAAAAEPVVPQAEEGPRVVGTESGKETAPAADKESKDSLRAAGPAEGNEGLTEGNDEQAPAAEEGDPMRAAAASSLPSQPASQMPAAGATVADTGGEDPLWIMIRNKPEHPMYKRLMRQREEAEIRRAGEAAAATFGAAQPGERIDEYIQRRATAVGRAEAQARRAINERKAAAAEAAAQGAVITRDGASAAPPTEPEPEQQRVDPSGNSVLAALGEPVPAPAAPPTVRIIPAPVASGMANTPATDRAAAAEVTRADGPDGDAMPAPAGGALDGMKPASNDDVIHHHFHSHANGESHAHRHIHTGSPEEHEDHAHVYRDGAPIDPRVVLAEAAQTRAQSGQSDGASGSNSTGTGGNVMSSGPSRPKSGSDGGKGKSKSALETVQSHHIGHRVLENTEEVEAKDFGVPDEAGEPDETPGEDGEDVRTQPWTGEKVRPGAGGGIPAPRRAAEKDADGDYDGDTEEGEGEEDKSADEGEEMRQRRAAQPHQTRNPDSRDIRPGSQKPAKGGQYDDDGDYDGDEDAREEGYAKQGNEYDDDGDHDGPEGDRPRQSGSVSPTTEKPIGGPGKRTGNSPTSEQPIGGPGKRASNSPTDGGTIGDGVRESGPKPPMLGAPGRSAQADPDATRAGARLSAASQRQIHDLRDIHMTGMRKACSTCACPECKALTHLIGEDGAGHVSTSEIVDQAQHRLVVAAVARQNETLHDAIQQELAGIVDTFTRRMADLELSLASVTATTSSQLSRAAAAGGMAAMPDEQTLRASLAPVLEQLLAPVVQRVESSAAAAAESVARVDRFAAEPLTDRGPVANALLIEHKALAPGGASSTVRTPVASLTAGQTVVTPAAPAATAGNVPADLETRIAVLAEEAQRSGNPQLQAYVAGLILNRDELAKGHAIPMVPSFGGR